MLNYTIFPNNNSEQWITFVHGAGGSSSIFFRQIRDFQKHANLLLLDLRGHGDSNKLEANERYTFPLLAHDIILVLEHLQIKKTHFVGISLGTILIRQLAEDFPEKVASMILGGAIFKMNFRSQILMRLGMALRFVMPYLWLYRLFAYIIMPRKNHTASRLLFVNEAKKMNQKEFIKWFELTTQINLILRKFRAQELNIPTFYIMGQEDYMFLPSIKKVVADHAQSAKLFVISNCGHVVNVEKAEVFNTEVIAFIKSVK
ncbi:alpha/beta hydrolase [Flavobacterium sp.]|uniref:alpha/beta fold hydrolase n=1 Tax=Flavobacterium sp. TaxID=239 RepID=UPI00260B65EA|nr:alpha/beta hydrolase [Flavobacterium sp.]MDD3005271.1 alpha/beta hydrolase [Flavobacterium sp.]